MSTTEEKKIIQQKKTNLICIYQKQDLGKVRTTTPLEIFFDLETASCITELDSF